MNKDVLLPYLRDDTRISSMSEPELLRRVPALEQAPNRIRVNVVNPETVLRGPKIWPSEWSEERAAAYKISTDGLEKHHLRSLLERSVYSGDVAEVVYFPASELSAKSSGNILNVDAGNAASFPT